MLAVIARNLGGRCGISHNLVWHFSHKAATTGGWRGALPSPPVAGCSQPSAGVFSTRLLDSQLTVITVDCRLDTGCLSDSFGLGHGAA